MRDNIASVRLGPERLCALAGHSRSTLYRLFEPQGGVAHAIQEMRLSLVHADLLDAEHARTPIFQLAERRGFACPAAFGRAFRRRFGYTAGEARAAARLGATLPVAAPASGHADLVAMYRAIGGGRSAPRRGQ
jgi:AraC-like DNA-binding protein